MVLIKYNEIHKEYFYYFSNHANLVLNTEHRGSILKGYGIGVKFKT